jgi:hypothetical protein
VSEKFPEEVVVTHSVPNPKWHPSSHPGGPPANLIYTRVVLDADPPHAVVGGAGGNGRITVAAKNGKPLAELIAGDKEAVVAAGQAGGRPGRLTLYDGNGHTAVNLTAAGAHAVVGGNVAGRITVAGADGKPLAELIAGAKEAVVAAGQSGGRPGRLTLYDGNGQTALNLTAGNARMSLYDGKQKETIRLDADTGDIALFNADCAEEFDVSQLEAAEPGTVMVLDDDSRLRPSDNPYDTRVAGVVSGAGGYRPAMVLDRKPDDANRTPVALVGKVFCKVDADPAPIRIGDLLTTARIRGHAMKAGDRERAFGSVLGKALRPLDSGKGLIPVLVALQ